MIPAPIATGRLDRILADGLAAVRSLVSQLAMIDFARFTRSEAGGINIDDCGNEP